VQMIGMGWIRSRIQDGGEPAASGHAHGREGRIRNSLALRLDSTAYRKWV
jgi:hypothetical protein